ncbi:MAG: post-PEP-CTERM-1 domain-containing protein [Pyrinomonadaceae bacterium]
MNRHAKRKSRNSSGKISRLIWISIIVAVVALGATAAVSLRPKLPASGDQTNNPRINLHSQVQTPVPLHQQTGQIRPLTQEEAQRLAAELKQLVNQSTDRLQSVRHADGSVSMDLQGRFQNIAVAKLDEDGKLIQSCIDNPESAAAFFEIDPQLLGVKKSAGKPKTNNDLLKGGDR